MPYNQNSGAVPPPPPPLNYTGSNNNSPASPVYRGKDGVYRWTFEVGMWSNPTLLFDLLKVMGISVGFVMLVIMLTILYKNGFEWDSVKEIGWDFLFVAVGMLVLTILGYVIYVLINGGNYCVYFEMDEQGITHHQMQKQVERTRLTSAIALLIELSSDQLDNTGASILAATNTSMHTTFASVKWVKAYPGRNLIKVNETFNKNRVYVAPNDFNFVYQFIRARCPHAKVKP